MFGFATVFSAIVFAAPAPAAGPLAAPRRGLHLGGGPPALLFAVFLFVALLFMTLFALPPAAEAIERRRPQFLKEQAYLFIPFPFNLPGIGTGIAFTFLGGNIGGTNIDAFGIVITGDAEGRFVSVQDVHLVEEALILEANHRNITKALFTNYQQRGMKSDKDDFNLLEISQADGQEVKLCLCLFERRLQFQAGFEQETSRIDRVRDSNGDVIADFTNPVVQEGITRTLTLVIDYTDDWEDPRKGIRLTVDRRESPPDEPDDIEFSVVDASLSFYLPVGSFSTLLFNYFQSDASVTREGETDPVVLREEFGLDCMVGDDECQQAEDRLVERFIAENRFGNATSLGGGFGSRLRAYPGGRFRGAHTIFYGLEFRWNLTDEATPFNYFIWRDVRTAVQLAFFVEQGSVADLRSEVGDTFASSYGVGIRLISGSGFVYRADVAAGDEDTEVIVIFGYPF